MSEGKRTNVSLRPSELVIAAIHNLEEKKGSSPNDIVHFISNKYSLQSNQVKGHVEKALKRGVCFGVLSEKRGLYRLLDANSTKSQGLTKRKTKRRLAGKGGKSDRKSLKKKKTAGNCRVRLSTKCKLTKNTKAKAQRSRKLRFPKKPRNKGRKARC